MYFVHFYIKNNFNLFTYIKFDNITISFFLRLARCHEFILYSDSTIDSTSF